jgi:hypothetical protein
MADAGEVYNSGGSNHMVNQGYNAKYRAETAKYTKKDGVIALCLYAYLFIAHYVFGPIVLSWISDTSRNLAFGLVMVVPCIAIVLISRQGLSSIGIHAKHLRAALCLGLLFSAIALMLRRGILPGLIQGGQFHSIGTIINVVFLTVIIAVWEDIVFHGYIQTRLYGLIKKDIPAMLTGAVLFAFIHLPIGLALEGASALSWFVSLNMVFWFGWYLIFNLVFRRYFSIFPVIMLHTAIVVSSGRLWVSTETWEPGISGLNETISFAIIVLAVCAWALFAYRKSKNA